MENEKTMLTKLLSGAAVGGNVLFVLWMFFNALEEKSRIQSLSPEIFAYMGLILLFIINTYLLSGGTREEVSEPENDKRKMRAGFTRIMLWFSIAGNILFMLGMTYRHLIKSFSGTIYQLISYIALMGLLTVSVILIFYGRRRL